MADQMITLSRAARLCDVVPATMRVLLLEFAGVAVPSLGRGRSPLVEEADVDHVQAHLRAKRERAPKPLPNERKFELLEGGARG